MRKRRFFVLGMTGILSIGLLSGCSKKEIVDYSLGSQGQNESESGTSLANYMGENWNELVEVTLEDGSKKKIQISAEITVPEVEQMSVIEVEEQKVDATMMEETIKTYFPDGTIYYLDKRGPLECIEKLIEYNRSELELLESDYEYFMNDVDDLNKEKYLEQYQQKRTELETELEELEAVAQDSNREVPVVTEYDTDSYYVLSKGEAYRVIFYGEEGDSCIQREAVEIWRENLQEICPMEIEGIEDVAIRTWNPEELMEYTCSLSEKEAESLAKDTLQTLGISNMVYMETEPISWMYKVAGEWLTQDPENIEVCGYKFKYGFGIDGIAFEEFGTLWDYIYYFTQDNSGESYVQYPVWYDINKKAYDYFANATISVTEQGVIGINYTVPMKIRSVTKDVDLLPIEHIQSVMKQEMADNYDYYFDKSNSFLSHMDLIYLRVKDTKQEGCYVYAPVWRLRGYYPIFVNAIDGTVIHLADEFE